MENNTPDIPRCSFCEGENQGEVLVAGTDAFICDACVLAAVEAIGTERPKWLETLAAALTT
jgi:hypothetical protein